MAETSTIFGFMKYVSATDILSDFKKTVDSHFVNSLKRSVDRSLFNTYNSTTYRVKICALSVFNTGSWLRNEKLFLRYIFCIPLL